MLDWDREGAFRFAALQSRAGRALLQRSGRDPEDISSIVFVEPSGSYTKSAAILRIAERLRAPLPLVAAALGAFPGFFKDAVYDQVSGRVHEGDRKKWRTAAGGRVERPGAEHAGPLHCRAALLHSCTGL